MRVAVVTGASRGLGKHIAIRLGKAGYHVAVNYCHSQRDADEVLLAMGPQSMGLRADVGMFREVEGMARRVMEEWGRVDVLVNNAGIVRDGLLIKYKEQDWDEVLRVNVRGCFNTVKCLAPLMIQSGGGHIVNISSRSGLRGRAGQPAYSASKASVIGLTRSLAGELAGSNIKVNCILPGYMATETGVRAKEALRVARRQSVLGSLSDPEEVAGFIACLVTTGGVTGQVFCLDSRI